MARKMLFILLTVSSIFLLVAGCNSIRNPFKSTEPKVKEIEKNPAEKEKAELLKHLDRKFEDPEAHYRLGQLYQNDGLWLQAENSYSNALAFDPIHRPAQAARVKVLLAAGDNQQARYSADFYINQASASPSASLRLAMAFQKQALDDYAVTCYRQALNLAPNSAKITRQIGLYYLAKNDAVQAQQYLRRSFQLNPNQPDVARELGRMGVAVRIPRKKPPNPKKLDRIIEKADQELTR